MPAGTEIKNAVDAADKDAQYDEKAKRLLGNKMILAYILADTVDEFHGMDPKDVLPFIEGEPYIGSVPAEPGMTNARKGGRGKRTAGFNTENVEINEGLIRFDIVFYVRMKDGISKIIVNVESQKDMPVGYHLLNRAVFYVSRLISSQKERDFVSTNYDDIAHVFSIWVCMNMDQDSTNYIHLVNESILGSCEWEGKMDLLNVVLIGLSKEIPGHDEKYRLHKLLGTLLSRNLSADEKLGIIETEYHIPIEEKIREDVSVMCNLSQGIREDATDEANAKIIVNMHRKGYSLEQIAEIVEKTAEEVENIIKKRESVLA